MVEDSAGGGGGQGVVEAAAAGQSGLACKYNNKSPLGYVPVAVKWCAHQSAHLVYWPVGQEEKRVSRPFRCRTWRHEGDCQRWKGAQDFVRCRDAIAARGPEWVYVVLTFAAGEFRGAFEAYRQGVVMWGKLSKRLGRRYGRLEYLQTWEATKRGFPHVNVAVHNQRIWAACEGDGWRAWRRILEGMAVDCGFGSRTWVEPLRTGSGMSLAGYLTKLSRELTGSGSKNQVPVNAPAHFRRIRASRGLLAPAFKREGWTGKLVY